MANNDMQVDINLSSAELVVLAEHLSLDPRFAVGERAESEVEQMKAEGWRSLLVRRFARLDEDSALVSDGLTSIAQDVLAPLGLLSYTRVSGDRGQVSHIFVGGRGLLNATPIAEDVATYSSTDLESVVDAILGSLRSGEEGSMHQLEAVDGRTRESIGALAWVQTADGSIFIDTGEGPEESDNADIQERVTRVVESFEKVRSTGD